MKKHRSLRIAGANAVAAVMLLSVSALAGASEAGFYVGALGGQSKTDVGKSDGDDFIRSEFGFVTRSSVEETDTALGVFAGYQFLPWLAVEAAYQDLGEAKYNAETALFTVPVHAQFKTAVKAASVSALLMAPLGDQFALGASLGFASTETEFTFSLNAPSVPGASESDSDKTTNTSGVFGIHAEWTPTPNVGVRIQYQRYKDVGGDSDEDIDGFDVTLLSAGLLWRF